MVAMLEGLKDWRTRRRIQAEARHLIGEARRILKKKGSRVPASVAGEVEASVKDLEASLAADDVDRTRTALGTLDEKMDQHLAFARKSSLREYIESIGVAVAIALLLRSFVVEAFQIPSGSMIPTLQIGDHIFVSKFAYGLGIPFTNKKILQLGAPKRGDVIVFRYPGDQSIDYIKRVVGLPGDQLEIRKNEVFVNGRPMAREHVNGPCVSDDGGPEHPCDLWMENLDGRIHPVQYNVNGRLTDWPNEGMAPGGKPFVVAPGNVFVMGDNRDNSNDSRFWGTVPEELIKGRALVVWWSRGPAETFSGWVDAIRWRRFLTLVK